jgi:hypothetical protein
VRQHFKHRARFLRQQCAAWLADVAPQGAAAAGGGASQLPRLVAELNQLLGAL